MQRDQRIFDLIQKEQERQQSGLELIASENFTSNQVIEAVRYIFNQAASQNAYQKGKHESQNPQRGD